MRPYVAFAVDCAREDEANEIAAWIGNPAREWWGPNEGSRVANQIIDMIRRRHAKKMQTQAEREPRLLDMASEAMIREMIREELDAKTGLRGSTITLAEKMVRGIVREEIGKITGLTRS